MRTTLLGLVLLISAGSAAATPQASTPLTAEALLAVNVQAKTVETVAGGEWWPEPPSFNTTVFQSDPEPKLATAVTFDKLGSSSQITTSVYAFDSAHEAVTFLLYAELVGPRIDERTTGVGERRAYYTTHLQDGRSATRLFFVRGPIGVSIEVDGLSWSATTIDALAAPIDNGLKGLIAGKVRAPTISPTALALMPDASAAPGSVLGTAAISDEAWAMIDRDGTPKQVRDGLARRGAKLLLRRYLRQGSPTDVIEATLFTFSSKAEAGGWFAPYAAVKSGKNALDAGKTGAHAAYRHGRDNYELRFAVGRHVGDVFCYAPYVTDPSPDCEDAVRTLAERWYAQLSRSK